MAFLKLILFVFVLAALLATPAHAGGRKGPTDDVVPGAAAQATAAQPVADPCPMGKYLFLVSPKFFLGAEGYDLVMTDHTAESVGREHNRICVWTQEFISGDYVTAPDGTQTYVEGKWVWSEPLAVLNDVIFLGGFEVDGKWYFTFLQLGEGGDFVLGFNPANRRFIMLPYAGSPVQWDWANLHEGTTGTKPGI